MKSFRGYGVDKYVYYARNGPKRYLGGTFEVKSYEDLELRVSGGGHMVAVIDPERFPVNLIFGQEPAEPGDMPKKITYNY
jgi:hypothetical protein